MEIKFEPAFKSDYKRIAKKHPGIAKEFDEVLISLYEMGEIPKAYTPRFLMNPGGNYSGNMEFHLSDGKVDVIVIYKPHKTNPQVRFIRMGSHEELFRGPLR